MGELWLPPSAENKYADARLHDRAQITSRAQQRDICARFDGELKRIDPQLMMVWFDAGPDLPSGAVGDRYHLIRDNRDAPPSVIPITGPAGEYMEPNSGLFEWLRRGDMWNARAKRDRDEAQDRARQAAERAREREREDHLAEFQDLYNAKFRTSVSLNRDNAWAQNQKGRRAIAKRADLRRAA